MILVRTFGTALIEVGDTHFAPTSSRKFPMLLYLAAECGRRVSRSAMHDLIFPDKKALSARHSLRELVYQLRLAGVPIDADGHTIVLAPEAVRADYAELLACQQPTADQLAAVEGGFLPGYAPEHSEAYSEWLDGFRAKTTLELGRTLAREVRRAEHVADWITTERAARVCLALHPFNEDATFGLAKCLSITGAKTRAMSLLDEYLHELGDAPRELKMSALKLRQQIGERTSPVYSIRLESPFVGRDVEMMALREHFGRARGGDNECVVLLGDAGIGKSRLAAEFCTAAILDGATVAVATPQPHDVHRPFGAFADLVPQFLEARGALGCSPESMAALEKLTKTPTTESVPFVDAVRDSEALCDAITRAILDIVDAIAGEQLLVLSIEDIHWLDAMSLRVLGYLLSTQRSRRLFVLLTTRTSAPINEISRHALDVRVLPLGELGSSAVSRMTSAFVAEAKLSFDEEMLRWLEETASGNPLFVESLLGHYAKTRERFAISPTLSSLLSRRVECLSSQAATTLQICALLGKHATLDTVMTAVELSRFDLIRAVGELESARLIKSDDERVRPAHALIAEEALKRMSPLERRLGHQCVAMALESLSAGERTVALVWECAEHWLAAHDSSRALDAIRRCAEHAMEIGRPSDATEMLARALSLSIRLDERIDVATRLVLAADLAIDPTRALEGFSALRDCGVVEFNDDMRFAEFRARARAWSDHSNDLDELLLWVGRNEAPANHRVLAATWMLKYADMRNRLDVSEKVVAALPPQVLEAADESVRSEFCLVRLSTSGDHDRAVELARTILRSAELGIVSVPLALQSNATMVLEKFGLTMEAADSAERVYFRLEAAGGYRLGAYTALLAAECYCNAGDERRSIEWLERTEAMRQRWPSIGEDMSVLPALFVCLVEVGFVARARSLFDRCEANQAFARNAFARRFETTARMRLAQLEGSCPAPDGELEKLLTNVRQRFPVTGLRDFEIVTGVVELRARNRDPEAHQLLRWYMESGRSCWSQHLRSFSVILSEPLESPKDLPSR
ncbi:MAG TPA: AAA family ATPase [Gemmatimonadaceae bacterium]|nr:AAA family ATPase [Gemmatimonadaceae bacterium]